MTHNNKPNTPLEWGRYAHSYLQAANKLYEVKNRFIGFWNPAYYLLYHSLELVTKMVLEENGGAPTNHLSTTMFDSISKQINALPEECSEVFTLITLNRGPGGLRYENRIKDPRLPKTMEVVSNMLNRVLKERGISQHSHYMNDLRQIGIERYQW